MYLAELSGKVSSKMSKNEDLLTSNVFSFFKYSARKTYLLPYLKTIGFQDISEKDVKEAQFIFWPRFDDQTEPDLILIVGKYYILFEAKYTSGFGEETETKKGQLHREIEGGLNEASSQESSAGEAGREQASTDGSAPYATEGVSRETERVRFSRRVQVPAGHGGARAGGYLLFLDAEELREILARGT